MYEEFRRPTLKDAVAAAERLSKVTKPDGDNEHLPLNHQHILEDLDPPTRQAVLQDSGTLITYTRSLDDTPNTKSVNNLSKKGFQADLGPSQNDPMSLAGSVQVGEHSVWIGDAGTASDEDDD